MKKPKPTINFSKFLSVWPKPDEAYSSVPQTPVVVQKQLKTHK